MQIRIAAAVIAVLVVAPFAFAQNDSQSPDMYAGVNIDFPYYQIPNMVGDNPGTAVRTDVSLDNPATKSGVMNLVRLRWSKDNCTNAFKVKFFRRTGDTLTMTAERGPFSSTSFTVFNAGVTTVTLDPPVDVLQGDFIGIARVADCGTVLGMNNGPGFTGYGYIQYDGDVQGSVDVNAGLRINRQIQFIWASGMDSETIVAVLPAVGSAKGRFGSNFKTTLQLLNTNERTSILRGRLIFHPIGVPASPNDPSMPYALQYGAFLTIDDVGAQFGKSGLGSLDITSLREAYGVPQVVARVFNDNGTGGTTGFFEDAIPLTDKGSQGSRIVQHFERSFLVMPTDPERVRVNIGVRTFSRGTTIQAALLVNFGRVIANVTKVYPANYLEQVDAGSFFGFPIAADQLVVFTVLDGDAIIYATTTDNVTNDPAAQFSRVGISQEIP